MLANAATIPSKSNFFSRSPKRGGNKRSKSGGSSKFRGNAGTIVAQAAAAARAAARALAASNPDMASPYLTKPPPMVPSVTRAVTRRGRKEAAAAAASAEVSENSNSTADKASSSGTQPTKAVQDLASPGVIDCDDSRSTPKSNYIEGDLQNKHPSTSSLVGEEVRVRSNTLTSNISEGTRADDNYHTMVVVEKSD